MNAQTTHTTHTDRRTQAMSFVILTPQQANNVVALGTTLNPAKQARTEMLTALAADGIEVGSAIVISDDNPAWSTQARGKGKGNPHTPASLATNVNTLAKTLKVDALVKATPAKDDGENVVKLTRIA